METNEESLIAAGKDLRRVIDEVIDSAVDYHENEHNDLEQGNWAKSQTYAVVLNNLREYLRVQLTYDRILIEKVRAH